MRLLSKEVFVPFDGSRPVFPGFVTYISASEPVLMHRYGWVDESDTYDDFGDCFSFDNGRTWTEPRLIQRSREVPGGRLRYAENAAFLDADTGRVLTFVSRALYPHDALQVDTNFEVLVAEYDPATPAWTGETLLPFDLPGGLGISFCFPIKTRTGRLLVPAFTRMVDERGKTMHYRDWPPALEQALTLIGEYQPNGTLFWRLGEGVHVDPEKNCRGLSENALVELQDGRIAMLSRGCNGAYSERGGYKWLCFSGDDGATWSEPEPLGCIAVTDRSYRCEGEPLESGSNGCAVFRSIKTDKLYWIGNPALDGERAKANWPRSPVAICELQEEPFALRRETLTIIDQRGPADSHMVQMSNFRFYQDRETGDVVLFLSRYGGQDAEEWKRADYYRYRVEVT